MQQDNYELLVDLFAQVLPQAFNNPGESVQRPPMQRGQWLVRAVGIDARVSIVPGPPRTIAAVQAGLAKDVPPSADLATFIRYANKNLAFGRVVDRVLPDNTVDVAAVGGFPGVVIQGEQDPEPGMLAFIIMAQDVISKAAKLGAELRARFGGQLLSAEDDFFRLLAPSDYREDPPYQWEPVI